ncbi:M16 family metallopeptidase [Riemerella anatipestifer]|uniref:M16 family metallopeptidase n=1 Tax=Riemerella anatipestifer TaxID=34085 RepID=UPI001BDA7BDE|nr:insulinase family protein [Riemerella anatipestifer]MBT0551947.1 insulinase family protein [Riemerella anatipestifer]MBT0554132.1 insulinase family protein [Riemerella anatipestifer]MCE3024733.1 insulinase family protein [Riemerella anatipestifer]MCU7560390.1 insulinase family protein [Riemerella anatipestifer]MDY3449661.1 insulinase family protein [Riemerella anatipestifer]
MKYDVISHTDKNGLEYLSVTNDDNQVRIYTLKNGLKVYLSKNSDAPRIQTYIPVRTGSNNDPKDNTGLAHYLEHMMFKGTSKIGSLNWEKEQPLLQKLSDLFEQHKATQNEEEKKQIYKEIDTVSQEAAQYAIPNEYDKILSSLGASGTNAHTWLDETVYKNNIPSNELEKWFKVEKERFSELTLRLFHTELESVYEEFNRAQDNDFRLVHYEIMDALFPNHPNGQQTTLGKAEHLKNPSMEALHKYFNEYYVPNNYALILVGDLDFEPTIALAERYFGTFSFRELPPKTPIIEQPINNIIKRTIKSPSAPRLQMAWRSHSYGTQEARLTEICTQILSNNGEVGLIDLNINQKQTALRALAFHSPFKSYGFLSIVIVPKENQTLDEAKDLILSQIEALKKGDFPDWLIPAIINDIKKGRLKQLETADGLATLLYETFIKEREWNEELNELNLYETITKEEVISFANEFFGENYVVVYKERGENDKLIRVENPKITPIKINKEAQSEFLTQLLAEKTHDIAPVFADYSKEILEDNLNGIKLSSIRNTQNNLAQMNFIFPMGTDNDKELGLVLEVLEYMGTDRYSPEEIKQEFYKIGINYSFQVGTDNISIMLGGLEENLATGVALMVHWLRNIQPDNSIYQTMVASILDAREISKKDKNQITRALVNYAKYGENSRFRDVITKERLQTAKAEDFTQRTQILLDYPYELFFYGQDIEAFKSALLDIGLTKGTLTPPTPKNYPEPLTNQNKVYLVDYDMVQVEIMKVGRGEEINPKNFGRISVFNEYFGRGLSSIVFQEIRESKSLAYSAYVSYTYPSQLKKYDYVTSYLGTQADKMEIALNSINELMSELPQVKSQFNNAKSSALKQIASQRLTKQNLYFNYLAIQKWGYSYDIRKDIYDEINSLSLDDLIDFYNQNIKPIPYHTAIIGQTKSLDLNYLKSLGTVQELSIEDLFGY